MRKYLLILFFTVFFLTDGSLWACADSLMMRQPILRDLTSSSRDMLSRASLIAYASQSQTVSAKHIILATLTTVSSSDKGINRLNVTDHESPLNTLSIILKKLKILKPIQEFLLSQLDVQLRDSVSFELKNDLLILYLGDLDFIPTLPYDEVAIALFELVANETEKEVIYRWTDKYRFPTDQITFNPIPISEEHFFLAHLSHSPNIRHFISELFLDMRGRDLANIFMHSTIIKVIKELSLEMTDGEDELHFVRLRIINDLAHKIRLYRRGREEMKKTKIRH